MSSRRKVLIRILALLQRKTLIETKNRTLKWLKWHYLTVRAMKNVAVLTEEGAFALFFRPHPGGFDSLRVPTPENLPSKAKNHPPAGSARGGVGLGACEIDWCITHRCAVNVTTSSLQNFPWRLSAKFAFRKEVIHNFKNHILVSWPATNLLILRKWWCGFEKPNHYYFA